ncbi:predicted protein [Naegleria gruberi]|uniref:Predicted protein n=1 Tax=Naegleria gruberi TaxID=5762 RepID=D2V7M2_NAEGR|nr:uncharacterized protein NAEGRDRAFT_64854 [Naegleria gruberi]EFC47274.1 predicted protein [Naegleria gruberi]|eukprot:XP_002680018.1 predicted protein [Naegleria gruberi strain NEG-M]
MPNTRHHHVISKYLFTHFERRDLSLLMNGYVNYQQDDQINTLPYVASIPIDISEDEGLMGGKIGTLVGLFILSVVFGILPYIVHHLSQLERLKKLKKALHIVQLIFGYCNAIAAGAILGSGLTHLLPDSIECFNNYFELYNHQFDNSTLSSVVFGDSPTTNGTFTPISDTVVDYPWSMMIAGTISLFLVGLDRVFSEHSHGSSNSYGGHSHSHKGEEDHLIVNSEERHEMYSELEHEENKERHKYSFLVKSLLFTFAICVHSVFEAFALGLETNTESFVSLLVPIVAHKGFESLTTGFIVLRYTLCKSWFQVLILIQVAIYALSTPIGMGIGMAISSGDLSFSYYMISGIIQSIACGSFLFIACFEIIPTSLEENFGLWDRALKMFLICLGFGVMCILAAFS